MRKGKLNMKYKYQDDNKGFTLVEVIVVFTILAILLLVLIPSIKTYVHRTEEKRLDASARALYSQAVMLYSKNDNENSLSNIQNVLEKELIEIGKEGDRVSLEENEFGKILVTVENGKIKKTYPRE